MVAKTCILVLLGCLGLVPFNSIGADAQKYVPIPANTYKNAQLCANGQIPPDTSRTPQIHTRYGQIQPDSARYTQIRLVIAKYSQIRTDTARYGQTASYGQIRPDTTRCSQKPRIWPYLPYLAVFGRWACLAVSGHIWSYLAYLAVFGRIWLCLVVSGRI